MSDDTQTTPNDAELAELQKQLDQASARREAARDANEKKLRASRLKAEIERVEREAREEEVFIELEEKHGAQNKFIARFDDEVLGMVVVKRPDPVKMRVWQDKTSPAGYNIKTADLREITRPCVIYPSLEKFDEMLNERPALLAEVTTEVLRLGGMRMKEAAKSRR